MVYILNLASFLIWQIFSLYQGLSGWPSDPEAEEIPMPHPPSLFILSAPSLGENLRYFFFNNSFSIKLTRRVFVGCIGHWTVLFGNRSHILWSWKSRFKTLILTANISAANCLQKQQQLDFVQLFEWRTGIQSVVPKCWEYFQAKVYQLPNSTNLDVKA